MDNLEQEEDPLHVLTEDERLVLTEICNAFNNEDQKNLQAIEIAGRLQISEGEARRRLGNIYKKLNIEGSVHQKRIRLIFRYCSQREEPPQRETLPVEDPLQEQFTDEEQTQLDDESVQKEKEDGIRKTLEEIRQRQKRAGVDILESPPAGRIREFNLPRLNQWMVCNTVAIP